MQKINMIETFKCKNFKNVQADNLRLGKISLFVGPNNYGKSNFIRAISFGANMVSAYDQSQSGFQQEVERNGGVELLNKNTQGKIIFLEWDIQLPDNKKVRYTLKFQVGNSREFNVIKEEKLDAALKPDNKAKAFNYFKCGGKPLEIGRAQISTSHEKGVKNTRVQVDIMSDETLLRQFEKLIVKNGNMRNEYVTKNLFEMVEAMKLYFSGFYSFSSALFNIAEIRKLSDQNTDGRILRKDGSNFVNVYEFMSKNDPDFKDRFYGHMRELIPGLKEIKIEHVAGYVAMSLNMNGKNYYLDSVSDGTVKALLLALIICMPKKYAPSMLAIDEPELNLHPAWQHILSKWIISASDHIQIFISTHSPELLDDFTESYKNKIAEIYTCEANESGKFKGSNREKLMKEIEDGWNLGDLYRVNDPSIGGWPV